MDPNPGNGERPASRLLCKLLFSLDYFVGVQYSNLRATHIGRPRAWGCCCDQPGASPRQGAWAAGIDRGGHRA